jgi:hypothetical protein
VGRDQRHTLHATLWESASREACMAAFCSQGHELSDLGCIMYVNLAVRFVTGWSSVQRSR